MNIEQPRNNKSGHNHPPAEPRNSERGSNQTGGGGQNRGWQKNQKQRQRKQYCFFHGEEKGHSTRDCPDAKETQERIKSRSAPQPPSSVVQPREVNHTFPQSFYHSYVRGSSQQHPAPIQPSALAFAYYPGFLPAWRPAQPPAEQGQQPTYAPPRPPQITYIETAQPHQQSLPPPLNKLQLIQAPPPPKPEPHPDNHIGPHTPLPTIGMILPTTGGSSMEFQTKK